MPQTSYLLPANSSLPSSLEMVAMIQHARAFPSSSTASLQVLALDVRLYALDQLAATRSISSFNTLLSHACRYHGHVPRVGHLLCYKTIQEMTDRLEVPYREGLHFAEALRTLVGTELQGIQDLPHFLHKKWRPPRERLFLAASKKQVDVMKSSMLRHLPWENHRFPFSRPLYRMLEDAGYVFFTDLLDDRALQKVVALSSDYIDRRNVQKDVTAEQVWRDILYSYALRPDMLQDVRPVQPEWFTLL